jgi:glycosyltransferase involved in cell wall biosynthesis
MMNPRHVDVGSPAAISRPIRILALIEATTLTGVVHSVLGFAAARPGHSEPAAFTLAILVVARGATLHSPVARAARDAGVSVFILPERVRFDPGMIGHLQRICRRFQPDVIQSHAVKSHLLVWLARLRRRQPWIAFHHGYTYTDWKTGIYNVLDRLTLRHAHHVVTVAEALRGDLLRCGIEETRLSVLHNAAPRLPPATHEDRARLRAQLRLAQDTRIVAAVGRLSLEKGHVDLIRAFAGVRARVPNTHLVIAGEGPERARVERAIVRFGLQQHVTLLGGVEDVASVYHSADTVALPSIMEGCPSVLLEAMAAGVPVVATRAGGIPEIVADGRTALLVRPGAVEELTQAICRMLLDRSLAGRLAAEARHHLARHHDATERAMKLLAIHKDALKGFRVPELLHPSLVS